MSDDQREDTRFALYKLYLETAEKVSDRRAGANTWMLSVNSAVVALYGWLGKDEALAAGVAPEPERDVWLWAIPLAGILVCVAWAALLDSYRKLNGAKFKVLQDIERSFTLQLFAKEREYYKAEGRRAFAHVERWIPWSFAGLYGLLLAARLFV